MTGIPYGGSPRRFLTAVPHQGSLRRSIGIVLVVLIAAGCSSPAEPTRTGAVLANTFESPEALSQALLQALAARDLPKLQSLALSEAEFRDHVWDELPTSRPERNVPFDYAWGQMKQRSDGSLSGTVSRYAGRHLKFVRTRFTGETTQFQTFLVMRDSEIVAMDEAGRELALRLYGSAMVKGGRYKLFSYVVD